MELIEERIVETNVNRSSKSRSNYGVWTKKCIWFAYNLALHYVDFLVDILLCYHSADLRLQLVFIVLPNLLLCCLSVSSNLFKLNQVCFILLTGCFNLQCLITLLIWLYYNYKSSRTTRKFNKLDFIELEYVLLVVYLFQILFNNVPQLYLQSYYYLNSKRYLFSENKKLIQLAKIGLSLVKISLVAVKFNNYFLLNEFYLVFKLSKAFLLIKFVSNIFTLVIRLAPVIYFLNRYSVACYFLIANKLFVSFVQTYLAMFVNTNVKFSTVSLFWYFIMSCLRFCVYIDNFTLKSLVLLYILVENLILGVLVFLLLNNFKKACLLCFFLFFINFINLFNEYLLWKYCFTSENDQRMTTKLSFGELFNKWLLAQQGQKEKQAENINELNLIQSNENKASNTMECIFFYS